MTDSDVAIVGAGPAGAWAAWRLADAGARVAVFDASHPREKPCGGGVTGRALERVRHAIDAQPLPRVSVSSARFESDRVPRQTTVSLDRDALAIFSRAAFDQALVFAALERGAALIRERVTEIEAHRAHVEIRARGRVHRTRFLIGADGANSLVRRRLSRPFTRKQISIGAGFFASGVTSDDIVIRLIADPPGYVWSFPRHDHLAIGICAQADRADSIDTLKRIARTWIDRSGIARGATLTPYSWPIPSLDPADFAADSIGGDRWLLAGDAAGLVDPITREGIFFALQSADLAAETLDAQGTGVAYAQRVARIIHPELRRAARLKAGFFRPRFTDLLMHALAESGRVRGVMGDLIAGRQPYQGLRTRLVGTFEWGLALRMMKRQFGG